MGRRRVEVLVRSQDWETKSNHRFREVTNNDGNTKANRR